MKNIYLIILIFASLSSYAQEYDKPAQGKSLIYFVRHSGVGALINFKYFDGEKYLGKINGVNYFKYECDPGEHIFWAAGENRDFLKGVLLADQTYIIEVKPVMGAIKAGVKLFQVSPTDEKTMKKVNKVLQKRSASKLKGQEEDHEFFIKNGMEKLERKAGEVKEIDSNLTF